MTFLPIVERELRVAARKVSTIWFRVLAALVALVIAAGFLTLTTAFGSASAQLGSGLFSTLTWMTLAAALAAGLFFTADSLSEEKREGTLGFLFLTDLRGYDVVGGKLLATSLRVSYALLALFPIVAVTLLMGGVTGTQFWKCALALINALFYSLAAGLFISSFCRDSQRAMGGTFLLLALACAAGPVCDSLFAVTARTGYRALGSLLSPAYAFWAASAWGKTAFWAALLVSHLVGWFWFALACILAPRTWQQRGSRVAAGSALWSYSWKYGRAPARAARRGKWLELSPVLWLAARERWQAVAVWTMVLLLLAFFIVVATALPSIVWVFWSQFSVLVILLLYLAAASQASRFNVEARRSGLLELLLVTPLDGGEIIGGQWRALLRIFGGPLVVLVSVQLAGVLFAQESGGFRVPGYAPSLLVGLLSAVASVLSLVANLGALMWFGMWAGLTSKNASLATLKTLVLVQVLPWLVINFLSALTAGLFMFNRVIRTGSAPSNTVVMTFPLVLGGLSAALSLAKDAAFFTWSRNRLYSRFRTEAARLLGTTSGLSPRPAAVAAPLPPVISVQQ